MPGTSEEVVAAATSGSIPGAWADGTPVTEDCLADIRAVRLYIGRLLARRKRSRPQRKAMKLLRSLLSPDQKRQLRQGKVFVVVAPSGNGYRFCPQSGSVIRVTRHGDRWFRLTSYCLHDDRDDPDAMPPADLTVTHLLMILADEQEFLATANARDVRDQLWNGEYLRRLRRRAR